MKSLPVFIFAAIFMSACRAEILAVDSYGIQQAERDYESSPALQRCALNELCPRHTDALFWSAAFELSDIGVEELEISYADVKGDLQGTIEEFFQSFAALPIYEIDTPTFKRAYAKLKRAHDLGQVYASNELGLLHIDQPDLRRLDLAREYLMKAYLAGDELAALNLARIEVIENPRDCGECLRYLEEAAKSDSEDMIFFLKRTRSELEAKTTKPKSKSADQLLEADWQAQIGQFLAIES